MWQDYFPKNLADDVIGAPMECPIHQTSGLGQQRHFGHVRATSAFLPDSGQLSEKADIYI
jgi:hypothetical protein